MEAALNASDETITFLLSWGANPDKTDANGNTALMSAIQSKCSTTINLLAPVTKENLGGALFRLAMDKVELTEEVKQLRGQLRTGRRPSRGLKLLPDSDPTK